MRQRNFKHADAVFSTMLLYDFCDSLGTEIKTSDFFDLLFQSRDNFDKLENTVRNFFVKARYYIDDADVTTSLQRYISEGMENELLYTCTGSSAVFEVAIMDNNAKPHVFTLKNLLENRATTKTLVHSRSFYVKWDDERYYRIDVPHVSNLPKAISKKSIAEQMKNNTQYLSVNQIIWLRTLQKKIENIIHSNFLDLVSQNESMALFFDRLQFVLNGEDVSTLFREALAAEDRTLRLSSQSLGFFNNLVIKCSVKDIIQLQKSLGESNMSPENFFGAVIGGKISFESSGLIGESDNQRQTIDIKRFCEEFAKDFPTSYDIRFDINKDYQTFMRFPDFRNMMSKMTYFVGEGANQEYKDYTHFFNKIKTPVGPSMISNNQKYRSCMTSIPTSAVLDFMSNIQLTDVSPKDLISNVFSHQDYSKDNKSIQVLMALDESENRSIEVSVFDENSDDMMELYKVTVNRKGQKPHVIYEENEAKKYGLQPVSNKARAIDNPDNQAAVVETQMNGSSSPVDETQINGPSSPVDETQINDSSSPVDETQINGPSSPVDETQINGSSSPVVESQINGSPVSAENPNPASDGLLSSNIAGGDVTVYGCIFVLVVLCLGVFFFLFSKKKKTRSATRPLVEEVSL